MASSSGWTLISTDLPPASPSCRRVDHHRGLAALELTDSPDPEPGQAGGRQCVLDGPDLRVIWSNDEDAVTTDRPYSRYP
jgi:hypothetical protein